MNLLKNPLTLACFAALVACGGGGGSDSSPSNDNGGGDVVTPVEPTPTEPTTPVAPEDITKTEQLTLTKDQSINSNKTVTFNVTVGSEYIDGNVVLCTSNTSVEDVADINFGSCVYTGLVESTSFSVDVLMLNRSNVWTAAVIKQGQDPIVENYTGVSAGDTIRL